MTDHEVKQTILGYFKDREIIGANAIINRYFKEIGLSKDDFMEHLTSLKNEGKLMFKKHADDNLFIEITRRGEISLFSFRKKLMELFTDKWLEIATLTAGIVAVVLSLVSIFKDK
jgi:hypothetical protein